MPTFLRFLVLVALAACGCPEGKEPDGSCSEPGSGFAGGGGGTSETTFVPPPAAVSIASGYHHSCAVDIDGFVYCWGAALLDLEQRSKGRS